MDPIAAVRESTARVVKQAQHVSIDSDSVTKLAEKLESRLQSEEHGYVTWDSGDFHYFQDVEADGPLTCQYVFVLDALNFCFWPTPDMEYEHLARGLKNALTADPHAFDAQKLMAVNAEILTSWFFPFTPPQIEERIRKIQELGQVLFQCFDGLALNLVKQAKNSAVELVRLVLAFLPGFRDHTVYKGKQIFLYKRVQILVGDLWAAYGRRSSGLCGFEDIGKLTMFADYRVPQVLRPEGVLVYSKQLSELVDNKKEIAFGSEMETEIRAATIQAVELIQQKLTKKGYKIKVIELDWLLWQIGEDNKDVLQPHHRTLTVYY